MMKARIVLVLAVVAVMAGSATAARRPSSAPTPAPVPWEVANRAVVVTASLTPTNKTLSRASGTATIFIPRPDKSTTIMVNITLKGSLTNITMTHIHIKNATAGNPIVMFLQPRLNFTATPARLDPPVSYKGTYSFVSTFNSDNITTITPGWTLLELFDKLQRGLLYVNTHTTAQPGGALQGTLSCKYDMCMWPVCSAGPGVQC